MIADVGCDIAYLSFYNYTNHLHHFFYNIDNKEGPLKLAKQLHQKVANDAIFICSEGLTYLKTNNINVDCCVIAGVGGYTCLKILQDDYDGIKRYIFQIENNQEIIDN
ncbi:tRNA (adenine(22)-N(1))-methyltransferase TrmK [bacterium]|nr:tRNA (adenine(22)-N(1))-methyltransferase TrmK [bacterium]